MRPGRINLLPERLQGSTPLPFRAGRRGSGTRQNTVQQASCSRVFRGENTQNTRNTAKRMDLGHRSFSVQPAARCSALLTRRFLAPLETEGAIQRAGKGYALTPRSKRSTAQQAHQEGPLHGHAPISAPQAYSGPAHGALEGGQRTNKDEKMEKCTSVPMERLLQIVDGNWQLTSAGALIVTGANALHRHGGNLLAAAEEAHRALLDAAQAHGFTGGADLEQELRKVAVLDEDNVPWFQTVSWPLLQLAQEAVEYAGPDGAQTAARWLVSGRRAQQFMAGVRSKGGGRAGSLPEEPAPW